MVSKNKKTKSDKYFYTLNLYQKLVSTNPKVELKGDKLPYTSINGHMFSILSRSGSVGLRLPEEERGEFLRKHKTTLFESYGAVMKEYVTIPGKLLKDMKTMKKYFDMSIAYTKSLKPKAPKKK